MAISRVLKVALDDITKPESFVEVMEFEEFIRTRLFLKSDYMLLEKNYNNERNFVENPESDYKFKSMISGKEFIIVAKFHLNYYDGAIECCKPFQLARYKEINLKTPVYFTIGIGQQPGVPGKVFFIPIKDIQFTKLFKFFLKRYEIANLSFSGNLFP